MPFPFVDIIYVGYDCWMLWKSSVVHKEHITRYHGCIWKGEKQTFLLSEIDCSLQHQWASTEQQRTFMFIKQMYPSSHGLEHLLGRASGTNHRHILHRFGCFCLKALLHSIVPSHPWHIVDENCQAPQFHFSHKQQHRVGWVLQHDTT